MLPVTVSEIGLSLPIEPVSANNLPQEKLPLSPNSEYEVDNPVVFTPECIFTDIICK